MSPHNPLEVVAIVDAAIAASTAVAYAVNVEDQGFPEVRWSIFGLLSTEEIAVLAECGSMRFGHRAPSPVHVPPMGDRLYGIDVADLELSIELGQQLWEMRGLDLVATALTMRDQR